MTGLRNDRVRRWIPIAAGTAALAALLLFIPFSYERTVGHDVTVAIEGSGVDRESAMRLGDDLGALLETEDVKVRLLAAAAADLRYALTARVSGRSESETERLAVAYAGGLAGEGYGTEVSISPVREKVTGNVLVAAANSLVSIRIDTEGKSADEIADDLRTQLDDAGVYDTEVEVSDDGDCRRILVRARDGDGPLPDITCEPEPGADCKKIMIRHDGEMSEADLIAEVERQLAEQGLSGTVTIDENGYPKIEFDEGCN